MKYELLKALYDCFYTPPELTPPKQEVEECHQALIEVLGKTERRLVLQIIDAKDRIAEDTSLDSFISGFELAWQLYAELNHYEITTKTSVRCFAKRQRNQALVSHTRRRKKHEKAYHGSHNCHLSDPVCRCVAASRNGRGNTHANPGTRRNRPRTACHRGQI